MLRYRTFRNTDPPLLCAIWRSRDGYPGLSQPVSVELFEQLVFSKLHFDYEGLVLALEDERPVGFAHASFEPDEQRAAMSTKTGVVCAICVRPDSPRLMSPTACWSSARRTSAAAGPGSRWEARPGRAARSTSASTAAAIRPGSSTRTWLHRGHFWPADSGRPSRG